MSNDVRLAAIKARQKERKRVMRNLLKRVAIRCHCETVGGVGLPSKMPGTAYGISAHLCGVGGKLAEQEGSVCFKCYAKRNNYTYPSVIEAHAKRLASLGNWTEWIEAWSNIFTFLGANLPAEEWFHRWHDAGDLQGIEHLGAICEVARRNPEWSFWLPSKEYGVVGQYVAEWGLPGNITVRMSEPRKNAPPKPAVRKITGLTATVGHKEGPQCEAGKRGGFCDDCRICWDQSVANVNYTEIA